MRSIPIRPPRTTQLLAAAAIAVLVAGCASAPTLREPELGVDLPEQWVGDAATDSADSTAWWSQFGDAALNRLVAEALDHNHSLAAAAARVEQAMGQARIAGAGLLPSLQIDGSASRRKQNFIGLPIPNATGGVSTSYSTTFSAGLSSSWELDLWGRVRSAKSAAEADLQARVADYHAARLSLAGQTARAWFAVIEAREQVDLLERSVESYRTTADQTRNRFERGVRTSLDLRLALTNLASEEANVHQADRLRLAAERRLEVLLGRYPAGETEAPGIFPTVGEPVPAGLPAALIRRRPDLAAAERRFAAADARIREARAALYPRLSLTASGGTSSTELADLVDESFSVWNLLGNLTAPVFQGGRLRGNVALREAGAREAEAAFVSAALNAFAEVENALTAESSLAREEELLAEAARQARGAQTVAEEQYGAGLIDFINVLEAQRQALAMERRLLATRRSRLDARVDLHVALGGGFEVSGSRAASLDADTLPANKESGS